MPRAICCLCASHWNFHPPSPPGANQSLVLHFWVLHLVSQPLAAQGNPRNKRHFVLDQFHVLFLQCRAKLPLQQRWGSSRMGEGRAQLRGDVGKRGLKLNHPHRDQSPQAESGAGTAVTTHRANKQHWKGKFGLWRCSKMNNFELSSVSTETLGFFRHKEKRKITKRF